jgi:hypothetical protein
MLKLKFFLSFLLISLLASSSASAASAALSTDPTVILPSANESIAKVIAGPNNTYFIGGSFSFIGEYAPNLTSFTISTKERDIDFPTIDDGFAQAIISDGAGGYFIGGNFTSVEGVFKRDLAHITADGSIDNDWTANINDSGIAHVRDLVLANGVLYVCGNFTSINGTNRANLAAINPESGAVLPWNPSGSGVCSDIDITSDNSVIFAASGDRARSYNASTGALIRAYAQSNNNASTGTVSTVALNSDESVVYVGGSFTRFGSTNRNDLAAFSTSTGTITSWNPNSAGVSVNDVLVDGSTIYVAGWFDTVASGISRNSVAAFDADGNLTDWDPQISGKLGYSGQDWQEVFGLEIVGDDLYIYGDFTHVGGEVRPTFAVVDKTTAEVQSLDLSFDGRVYGLLIDGGKLLVSGTYERTNVSMRKGIAQLDRTTNEITSWNPILNNSVSDMFFDGVSTLYIAGNFTSVNGETRNRFAAIDTSTGIATSLNPDVNNFVARILPNTADKMILGGNFSQVGGTPRSGIAEINLNDGSVTSFDPNIQGQFYYIVNDMAMYGSDLYVVGDFNTVNGDTTRKGGAAFNLETGQASGWDPELPDFQSLNEIEIVGDYAYVGGYFTAIKGDESKNHLAQLDLSTGAATSWNAGVDGFVGKIFFANNTLFIGGSFSNVNNGTPRTKVAALNITDGSVQSWSPQFEDVISTMVEEIAPVGTKLYLGGNFHIDVPGSEYITSLTSFDGFGVAPSLPSNIGPESVIDGSTSSNTQPTFVFTTDDENEEDEIAYHIVIDDDPDFSSPVIDYTSDFNEPGEQTFTVGQPEGDGHYEIGEEGQELPPGEYYWEVSGIDQDGNEGEPIVANDGNVAFIVSDDSDGEDNNDGTGNDNSSGNNKSQKNRNLQKSSNPFCSNFAPVGIPDLFQINRENTSATLYFTPVQDYTRRYHVVYGYTEGQELFGLLSAETTADTNNGVQSITINDLDPKVAYWFKVVPTNGCAVGTWSNWLEADRLTTKNWIFYRYLPNFVKNRL